MSVSRSDVRFQRDQSRVGKQRAMTTIRQRNPGPERLLSLRDQEQDQRTERRFVSFMGPVHSDMMDAGALGRGDPRANVRPRGLTATKKKRVVSDAERLLDEIYGRAPAIEGKAAETEPDPEEPQREEEEEEEVASPAAQEEEQERPQQQGEEPEEDASREESKADEQPAAEEPLAQEDEVEEVAAVVQEEEQESATPPPAAAEKEHAGESAPRQPTECKGWLQKFAIGRSGATGSKNWKRRFFALAASSSSPLEYFETDAEDAERKGAVPIDTASSRLVQRPNKNTHPEAAVSGDATDFVVVFVEEGKELKLLLRCETAAEQIRWTEELALRVGLVDIASDFEPPLEPEEEATMETPQAVDSSAGAADPESQYAAKEEMQETDPGPQALGGWMEKFAVGKSGATGAKNWKRRWFVLPADTTAKAMLTYHEKEGGKSKALGKVPVNDGKARLVTAPSKTTHPEADPAGGCDLVIVFFEDAKEFKLLLRLDSKEDQAKWAAELRRRVSLVDHAKDL